MNKPSKALLAGLLAVSTAGCATSGPPAPPAQAIYYNTNTKAVIGALAGVCVNKQLSIEAQTDNSITCTAEGNIAEQVLLSNSAGATPVDILRFNVAEIQPGTVKATGQTWVQTQNAFGGTKKHVIDNDRTRRGIQTYLDAAATSLGAK